jgi:hypothetical protein
MADQALDRRIDELLRLADQHAAVTRLREQEPWSGDPDSDWRALHRIEYALSGRFWSLAHEISAELSNDWP